MHSTIHSKNGPEQRFQADSEGDSHKYIIIHLRGSPKTGSKSFFKELENAVATRLMLEHGNDTDSEQKIQNVLGTEDSSKLDQINQFLTAGHLSDAHETRMYIIVNKDRNRPDDVWLAAGSRPTAENGKEKEDLILCKLTVHPSELSKGGGTKAMAARGIFDWEEMIMGAAEGEKLFDWARTYQPVDHFLCDSSEGPWDAAVTGTW